jgi:uncharacterized protein (TIGR03437 family)
MKSAGVIFGFLLLGTTVSAQQYVISTYAGGAPPPTPALGVSVPFGARFGVAADAAGNVYFPSLNCVFKVDQNGVLTRVAGNSRAGYSGDGGPATSAQLGARWGVTVDGAGSLFIADDTRIRKVSASGIITTVAGNGTPGFSGDGGPASSAQLNGAIGVAVDHEGNLFIADYHNDHIRKVAKSGIITTVAGGGATVLGDGGPATSIELYSPYGVAVDEAGTLLIASYNIVCKVSPSGIVTTVAGNGTQGFSGDGGPATSALVQPFGVAVDSTGNLFIADYLNGRIRKVSPNGTITTVAGNGAQGLSGDGGLATSAQLNGPGSVAVDGAGNLFIADGRIRRVSPNGTITTVVGNGSDACCFSGDGGPATAAQVQPSGVALDGARNLFVAGDNRIRKVSPEGIITTVVGNGTSGFSGDGGPAISAKLNGPGSVAVDADGNLFIADGGNQRIRKVSPSGIITTVAGNGTQGYFGDGGPATSAQLVAGGLAVDSAGNLYIAAGNVRKISPSGIISTVAGSGAACDEDSCPPLGDGGPATSAGLYATSVGVDGAGNLLVADVGNHRIRKVSPEGIITTLAKDVVPCHAAVDGVGNLFIAECFPGGISRISTSGIITHVVAAGGGYSGDGGPATSAQMYYATAVAVDGAGNIYVADAVNNAVRVLRPTDRTVLIGAVVDAASQRADPVSPGKIVVVYGAGLGPSQLIQNRSSNAQFGTELAGTVVSFNGIAAPILYAFSAQVAAIVPYAISGTTAQVTIAYQGETSTAFTIPLAPSAPGIFTSNQTGAGQAAAINSVDGTLNTAANPVKIGGYISLYATGEGQTAPAGVDGKLGSTPTRPVLPVSVLVGGRPATLQYAGGAPGQVAGLMQVNVQIPNGVQPGGYVPIVLQVGDASTTPGAVWVAVSGN